MNKIDWRVLALILGIALALAFVLTGWGGYGMMGYGWGMGPWMMGPWMMIGGGLFWLLIVVIFVALIVWLSRRK